MRDGVVQDRQSFFLDAAGAEDEATVLVQFAYEYYAMALAIPSRVIVAQASEAAADLEALLTDRKRQPGGGARRRARRQAQAGRAGDAQRPLRAGAGRAPPRAGARGAAATRSPTSRPASTCPAPPVRIECYDISNLGETYAVASMVVFEGGAPAKSHYRTFTMRYDGGPDDFARMEEAITRRFSRGCARGGRPLVRRRAPAWS